MAKRKCTGCKKIKILEKEFYRLTHKDDHHYKCKKCMGIYFKRRLMENGQHYKPRTFEYFKMSGWHKINSRTINGTNPAWGNSLAKKYYLDKKIKIKLTREQWLNFCKRHKKRIETIYKSGQLVGINRINSDKHYELGNIQIVSHKRNTQLACGKKVIIYDSKKDQRKTFYSWNEAARFYGTNGNTLKKILDRPSIKYPHLSIKVLD